MDKERKKRRIERVKSVLIVVLACSAVALLVKSQQYGGTSSTLVSGLYQTLSGTGSTGGTDSLLLAEAMRPARMAVTTEQGRYGVEYDDEALETLFAAANPLLTESMAFYSQAEIKTVRNWKAALKQSGVYFDFLGSVPLSTLAGQEPEAGVQEPMARRVILTLSNGGQACLWYWNEVDDTPYAAVLSDILREQLETLLEEQFARDNGSFFAFEREEYSMLSPWQLLTTLEDSAAVYQASDPLSGSDQVEQLVQNVGFNPHALYTLNGEWIVKEDTDTLRVRSDGVVTYASSGGSGTALLPVSVAGETATAAEAIEGAQSLVDRTVGQMMGAARLYLISCTETGEGVWEVRFGYLLNGAEVRLSGGSGCAVVVVSGKQISAFTLYCRSYTASENVSPVLPLEQAAAAMTAVEPAGGELLLCYPDGGGEGLLQASWAVRTAE